MRPLRGCRSCRPWDLEKGVNYNGDRSAMEIRERGRLDTGCGPTKAYIGRDNGQSPWSAFQRQSVITHFTRTSPPLKAQGHTDVGNPL